MIQPIRLLTLLCVALLTTTACAQGNSFDSNGIQIQYYDRGGTGQPVVLVHGGFSDAAMWDELDVTTALTNAGFRVIAFDMRGYGRSEPKPHDHSAYGYEMSHDIARLLNHLQICKTHVIGYSQGAIVANRFRAKHPDRLLSVTLACAGALCTDSVWVRRANEFADAIVRRDLAPIVHALTPPEQDPSTDEMIRDLYQTLSSTNDMKAAAASTRAQGIPDSIDELRANRIPTLAIIGEADPNIMDVKWMAGVMRNINVVTIPSAGHNDALNHPIFNREVVAFLEAHRK